MGKAAKRNVWADPLTAKARIAELEAENAKLKEAVKAVVETMRGSGGINPDAAEALLRLAALVEGK